MAQTNFTPISLYYSAVSGHVPSASNLVNGELAINIADGVLYYKNNLGAVSQFTGGGGGGGGTNITTTDFTATAGQTTFAVSYVVNQLEVYRNGIKLGKADFTATNGATFVLATGAQLGDLVQAVAFTPAGAVTSFSTGTTGLTPSAASTGAVTLGGVLSVANGGTGNTTGASSSLQTANFTIAEVANKLIISHLGTPVVSIDALGNIKSLAGVSAYTTP